MIHPAAEEPMPHPFRFRFALLLLAAAWTGPVHAEEAPRPNVVVIFADDLGYGDLGCFGHPTIRTPNLDRMAAEGMKLTQFYSGACVCTPSRAALLTGRLPARSGMCSDTRRVLFPNSGGGIPADETTLAEALKAAGYETHCVGKWHLGHLPQFLPTNNGFDSYFGIPYSNDMDRDNANSPRGRQAFDEPKSAYWSVPLMRDLEVAERPADQNMLTRRYTEEAVRLIAEHKKESDGPFFLYLAHSMPHVPLFRSASFAGRSRRGLYGDVIEEIDWSVGRVLDALRESGQAENTIVWFSSDNGPWLSFGLQGGSAGLLRDGKGTTWEGGMREPTLAWWPGRIKAGLVSLELGCTMDIFATSITLAGGKLPDDRPLDGMDLSPVLFDQETSPRGSVFYYRGYNLMAVRLGDWKAHFATHGSYGSQPKQPVPHDPPLLFHLGHDPGEQHPIQPAPPEVLAKIQKLVEEHKRTMKFAPSQLEIPLSAAK
jgi:arylsulfatase A-like enzyme